MYFNPPVDPGLYFLLAFIFTIIGVFGFFWMLFFLETSRDLSRKDRIIGLAIRLIFFSFTSGTALLFISLIGLY